MRLYHFSEDSQIKRFAPRAPLRHPDAEPLVYAIDAAHSPLYLFPRECPRIGVWTPGETIRLYIDQSWEAEWRRGTIYRYEFSPSGFIDCKDHGVWVSRETIMPIRQHQINDLPGATTAQVLVVASLSEKAAEFFDFKESTFLGEEHVSMIRMANLPDWPGTAGTPVTPR